MTDYATLLRDRTTLTCRCIDRVFMQAYVPRLQSVGQVCYWYLWDEDWGGAFIKTNAYAPYPMWIWLNGHSWAQRQLAKASIAYEAADNMLLSCDDPVALQRICDRLGTGAVKNFFWRWQQLLPSPLTREELRAGYVYDLASASSRSPTRGSSTGCRPGAPYSRAFIRDHLDFGRPDSVELVFSRKITRQTWVCFAPGSSRKEWSHM